MLAILVWPAVAINYYAHLSMSPLRLKSVLVAVFSCIKFPQLSPIATIAIFTTSVDLPALLVAVTPVQTACKHLNNGSKTVAKTLLHSGSHGTTDNIFLASTFHVCDITARKNLKRFLSLLFSTVSLVPCPCAVTPQRGVAANMYTQRRTGQNIKYMNP